jgi:hypothetical protein
MPDNRRLRRGNRELTEALVSVVENANLRIEHEGKSP